MFADVDIDDDDQDKPDHKRSRDSLIVEYCGIVEELNRRDVIGWHRRELGERAAVLRRLLGGDP